MKNYDQSKKAKSQFKSEIFDLMTSEDNRNEVFQKNDLACMFGLTERGVRKEIEKIANYFPVIAPSSAKGYKVLYWDANMSNEELEEKEEEILHQIAEINSRIKNLKARLKPLVANKVKIRERLNKSIEEE